MSRKKCPECKGAGYFALSKERILADPRHTHIKCPRCNGTGRVEDVDNKEVEPT